MKYWRVRLTGRFLFLDGSSVTTGAGGGGGGGGGGSVGGSVGGSADAYRQSSSASPRGVVTGGGYCGSSASTPHSHSTNGSYSVANPYTGSPTLYTSRKYTIFFFSLSFQQKESTLSLHFSNFIFPNHPVDYSFFLRFEKSVVKFYYIKKNRLTISTLLLFFFFRKKRDENVDICRLYIYSEMHVARNHGGHVRLLQFNGTVNRLCMYLWFSLMWNFRFSARTVWHFLYVRGRECVRSRSTTTDHLSPTALVHTAPPRHSRPVTANRPPSQPPSSPPQPPYALRLKNYEKHARETRDSRMYVRTRSFINRWWIPLSFR